MVSALLRRSPARLWASAAAAFGSSSQAISRSCARSNGRSQRGASEPGDAIAPFAAALRLLDGEVVAPSAGMDVDDAEWRWLAAQMHEDAREHRVLKHIGEISGVEGMPIIHGAQVMRANAFL